MKQVYIITEGETDQEILKTVLPPRILGGVDFIVGAGRYSAQSLARSVLAVEETPVALVLDSDTTNEEAIREQLDFLRASLSQASAGVKFEVFLAIPEIEILLIQDWGFIKKLSGRPEFSEIEIEFAQLNPKTFLRSVLGFESNVAVLDLLKNVSSQTAEVIQKYPLVNKLSEFLRSVTNQNLEPSRRSTLMAADVHPFRV